MSVAAFELGRDGPTVVVVGVDGSDTSLRALAYAFGLARRQNSPLVAVFAEQVMAWSAAAASMELNAQVGDELRATVKALGDEFGVPATFVSRIGDPVAVLTDVAEERRADAVVVGASHSWTHRLFGSTALRAVRGHRWPVTVVP